MITKLLYLFLLICVVSACTSAKKEPSLFDKEKSVRVTGVDLMEKMDISKELMVTLLSDVIHTRTVEEKQATIIILGNLLLAPIYAPIYNP